MNKPVKLRCHKCGYEWYYTGDKRGTTCSKCRAWITIKKLANAGKKRKTRRKMTAEEIFKTDRYRSIIFLTDFFDNGEGLRALHYRWALIKNHDDIGTTPEIREMEKFFKGKEKHIDMYRRLGFSNKLEWLQKRGLIKKDCITSCTNLSNHLKKLTEDYHILERIAGENKVGRYRLSKNGWIKAKQWMINNWINSLPEKLKEQLLEKLSECVDEFLSKSFTGKVTKSGDKVHISIGQAINKHVRRD